MRLLDLFDFRVRHDTKPPSIARQSFEEVVTLHVAVVIRARDIRRIQIHEVDAFGCQTEKVGASHRVFPGVVEHHSVEGFNLLDEVFFDRQPEVSPAIVVTREVAGHCEKRRGAVS